MSASTPGTEEVAAIDMVVAWDRFGYVATVHGSTVPAPKSTPCSGPRAAAWELAKAQFGSPYFTLQCLTRGTRYRATIREGV